MPASIFYPYQVAANEIDLGLSGLHGTGLAGYGENSQIIEEPPPTVIHICASISLDISIYSSVLDPDELDDPPVSIYLIGKSRGSRKTVVRNAGAGHWNNGVGVYRVELEFPRVECVGDMIFEAVMVRDQSKAVHGGQYGTEAGSRLAWSQERMILFDRPALHAGTALPFNWVSFSSEADPELNSRKNQMCFLRYSGENLPTVFMNRDMGQEFEDLLQNSQNGVRLRSQQAVEGILQMQIWNSVLLAAINSYQNERKSAAADSIDGDDDQDVLAVHDMSPGWQRDLLLEWAPELVPDVSDHESGLAEALSPDTPESMRDLFGRVGDAIQVRCNIPESVKMFVSLSLIRESVE